MSNLLSPNPKYHSIIKKTLIIIFLDYNKSNDKIKIKIKRGKRIKNGKT